ncbi:hypothetical protein EV121DRAFT_287423 [Schizophyllum commune]
MSRGLERLSEATQTRLRSTQILTSLPQLVSELVQNSLDAGAHHVDVGVNCEEYGCWVRDDGCGMGRQDLDALAVGGGGERYVSSKVYAPDQIGEQATFGFRGEALASAADLCCLEIASRTARSRESWSIILKDRKTLYNGPAVRWRRETPGTVVCVRDAFYNLPVRRRSHPSPPRTLELIRQELSAYALVFPHVTFSLENTSNSQQSTSSANNTFRIPATNSMLTTFRHIHGRALVQHVDEIKVKQDVNRHPLALSDMHRLIDQRFASSSFGKHALDEDGQNDLPLATVRRSPRKSEKRPVYVLNITVPPHQIDNCLEPAKAEVNFEDRRSVIDLLDRAISSFLSRNGFRNATPSPRKRRKIDPDGPGIEVTPPRRAASVPKRTSAPVYINRVSSFPTAGGARSADERPSTATHREEHEAVWTDETTGEVYIIDKRSGNSYRLKDERQRDTELEDDPGGISHRGARRTLKLGHQSSATPGETPSWIRKALEANVSYAPTQNRVRAVETSSLPRCFPDGQQEPQRALSFQQRRMLQEQQARANQPQGRTAQEERQAYQFSTDDLRRARVIAQVDCKFIACMMQPAAQSGDDNSEKQHGRSGLVLIDQHAADERVRVERYMSELCTGFTAARAGLQGVRCRALDPPKAILLTRKERQQLYVDENRRAFGWWGLRFADEGEDAHGDAFEDDMDDAGKGGSAYAQVEVVFVPEMIAEKLLLENELRDLVKGYLAKLADEGAPPRTSNVAQDSAFGWLKALRWCPRELVDLLNSKACRGAIMFNDPLSMVQCEKLIKQLTKTVFPFQCAHGRPSLVPLIDLNDKAEHRTRSRLDWKSLQ